MAETKDSAADAALAAPEVDKPNLWSTLLRESSKKAQIPDTTIIICGNAQAGKKELISKLAGHPRKTRDVDIDDIVSFTFFDLEEGFSENISRINVWSFGEATHLFEKAGDIMLHRSSPTDRFAVIVAVDLSRPDECLMSLVRWLSRIAQFIKHYHEKLDPEVSKKIKHDLIKYLQHIRETKGMVNTQDDVLAAAGGDDEDATGTAAGSDADEDIDVAAAAAAVEEISTVSKEIIETISQSFGLPIIVVATKSDSILPDDGPSLKRARDIQVQMRSICLDIGAALCFTSASADTNCQLLKKYITHRLCPDHISMELAIEDKVEVTFYPSGFDTEDMIMISAGQKGIFGTDNIFKAKLRHFLEHPEDARRKIGEAEESNAVVSEAEALAASADGIDLGIVIEPEQEWLSRLHEFINKVSASGGTTVKVEETNLVAQPSSPMNDNGRDGKILGPKRPAVRPTPASGEKKNVGDFFKNLLESGPAKK